MSNLLKLFVVTAVLLGAFFLLNVDDAEAGGYGGYGYGYSSYYAPSYCAPSYFPTYNYYRPYYRPYYGHHCW